MNCEAVKRGLEPSAYSYQRLACRCEECRDHFRQKQNRLREARIAMTKANGGVAPEGVKRGAAAYTNWGCRSPESVEAWKLYQQKRRAKKAGDSI